MKDIASKSGQSLSGVIREILDARLIQRQYLEMKNAAEQLKDIMDAIVRAIGKVIENLQSFYEL